MSARGNHAPAHGTNVPGANRAYLIIADPQQENAGEYTLQVANRLSSTLTQPVTLDVTPAPPAILAPPANQVVAFGSNVLLAVQVGGSHPRHYQWSINGVALSGATNHTLALANVGFAARGDYQVIVTNALGAVTSTVARLTVDSIIRFDEQPHALPAVQNGFLAWADVDNDHDLDLLVAGERPDTNAPGSLTQLFWNEAGAFIESGVSLPGYHYGSADWGDYDNDGWGDLVLTGYAESPGVRVFRNVGGTNFVETFLFPPLGTGRAIWGDLNEDGYLDLAMTGTRLTYGPAYSHVVINQRGTNLMPADLLPLQFAYGEIDAADFDRDGDLDLLVTGDPWDSPVYTIRGARLYRNTGKAFVFARQLSVASGSISAIDQCYTRTQRHVWCAYRKQLWLHHLPHGAHGVSAPGNRPGLGRLQRGPNESPGCFGQRYRGRRRGFPQSRFEAQWFDCRVGP